VDRDLELRIEDDDDATIIEGDRIIDDDDDELDELRSRAERADARARLEELERERLRDRANRNRSDSPTTDVIEELNEPIEIRPIPRPRNTPQVQPDERPGRNDVDNPGAQPGGDVSPVAPADSRPRTSRSRVRSRSGETIRSYRPELPEVDSDAPRERPRRTRVEDSPDFRRPEASNTRSQRGSAERPPRRSTNQDTERAERSRSGNQERERPNRSERPREERPRDNDRDN
jgi:hypothetical protein